jgi:Methyltransferase domain
MYPLLLSITGGIALVMTVLFFQYRRRLYVQLGRDIVYPIRTVQLEEFDDLFRHGPFGLTLDAEVHFIGRGRGVAGGMSDAETWILAVLSKHARNMFEFGTASGKTTYLWARNSPADARVVTLTLSAGQRPEYENERGDYAGAMRKALRESRFDEFLYSETDVAPKVRQLFGDSKVFDETPYLRAFDLILIDGSHAYSYVKSDSEKAFRMLTPGGTIVWHDYKGRWSYGRDVFRYLNELRKTHDLRRLAGSSFVVWRSPA